MKGRMSSIEDQNHRGRKELDMVDAMSPRMRRSKLVFVLVCAVGVLNASVGFARQPDTEKGSSTLILVRLPDARAKLTVDGDATVQQGTARNFSTPPLPTGKGYSYTFVATWEPNNYTKITRTHVVRFKAGETVTADMRTAQEGRIDSVIATYAPTPEKIVDAMCKLAKIGKDDVVYDLGCGDGRVIIAAVKKYGAKKGVGIDIDPKWVQVTRDNAKEAGVSDKVEARQGDVLKIADLSEATVVTLYIGEELNVRLRPLFEKTLRPGARIVSHNFRMGEWEPERSEVHRGDQNEPHALYLWRIEKKK
jgi:uncharacterized protein (TIGR03000 family)